MSNGKLPNFRPIILVLILWPCAALSADLRGKVVSIADSDTPTVLDAQKIQHRIRLEAIDAPEKGQEFGAKSRQALGDKIHEKEVRIEWGKRDRYQRIIGRVYLDKRDVSLEMIRDGMAWHFKRYDSSNSLADAETEARSAKRGLWADKSPWLRGTGGSKKRNGGRQGRNVRVSDRPPGLRAEVLVRCRAGPASRNRPERQFPLESFRRAWGPQLLRISSYFVGPISRFECPRA